MSVEAVRAQPRSAVHSDADAPERELAAWTARSRHRALTRHQCLYVTVIKPAMDFTAALVAIVLLSPVFLALMVASRFLLGRGVFYLQPRVGKDGQVFTVYKFRSMLPDRRSYDRPDAVPPMGDRRKNHKSDDDPRHTPYGRWLRRTSLDELPQLFNVLRGHMSLVGPRPELTSVVSKYAPWQHQRHLVKPGLTGLWQVTARSHTPMHAGTQWDVAYIRQVGLWTDLRIIFLTFGVLAHGGGGR